MAHPLFLSAAVRLDARHADSPPGRASKYLHHLAALAKAGWVTRKVVLWCRVSERVQARKGNARNQEANLRRVAERLGLRVIAVFRRTGSGTEPESLGLDGAVAFAREHGAFVLAESTDRFLRHPDYHSKENPDAQATGHQLRELARLSGEVILATHLHPDALPSAVRSYQRQRGQWAKGNLGGRPKINRPGYKKELREAKLPEVARLRKLKWSLRRIAAEVGVPYHTVRYWAGRFLRGG